MRCSCPKCTFKIEVDVSSITEEGSYTPCPECKNRFWMSQESAVRRALKKEGSVYCANCGNELGHLIVCRGCGFKFPDYFLVQVSKPVRRKAGKSDRSMSYALKPVSQSYAIPTKSPSISRKPLVMFIGLLVIVALVTAGVLAYNKKNTEKQYAANFALALYGIKVGSDVSLKDCAKISADWKAKMNAGQSFTPRIGADDASELNTIKSETDKIMQSMNEPPEKFSAASEKLSKLYGIYSKVHSLALSPSDSLAAFTDSVDKSATEFKQAAQGLKESLPAELSAEVERAKTRHTALRDF